MSASFNFNTQSGVIAAIKDKCISLGLTLPTQWAYVVATTEHETAGTFRPLDEYGKGKGRPYGRPDPVTGKIYYGRGYVQLTWKENYAKYSEILGVDLVQSPHLACDPQYALHILCHGFKYGTFTGKKLEDYVNSAGTDFIDARRCINGTDRAELIAKLAEKHLKAFSTSAVNTTTFIPAPPKTVKVGDTFKLTGQVPTKYTGAEVNVWVDQYALPGSKVRSDGVFEIFLSLNQPGARTVKIQVGELIQTFPLSVIVTLISAPPKTVKVGERFTLAGKAPPQYAGAEAKIWIDQYPLPSAAIRPDGFFTLTTALNQPGARTVKIQVEGLTQSFPLTVTQGSAPSTTPAPVKGFYLSGSVGQGGKNSAADVQTVQRRLKELGYNIGAVDGKIDPQTIGAIRLFQSIIQGRSTVAGDGRVDVNGATHQWLQAPNAPQWMLMPPSDQTISYRNRELEEVWDNHDYGASWLADAILAIATDYHHTYRERNLKAALFTINDVSIPHGGNTPDHAGHETGLMCDVFLPRKDGATGLPTYDHPEYDRAACRAMLLSIRRHPLFKLAYFNDPALIKEGLCRHAEGHHHHIHFEIKPPAKQ